MIIQGPSDDTDFEYEFQMALLNKSLNPDVETFFMMTDSKYSYISSSMVKEVARWGGSIDEFVPCDIIEVINKKFEEKSENKKKLSVGMGFAQTLTGLNQCPGGYNGMEVLEICMLEDVVEKSWADPFAGTGC